MLTPSDVDKIGDAVFIGDDKFLVIERDSSFESDGNKYVFEIDLAGATDKARERLAAAIDYFDANKQFVINMFRGNALRPIAEAYHAIGDEQASIDLYAKILDEAFVNPNARPRAMDFIATCCSLAVHHIEPTAELRQRLNGIVDEELDSPW